MTNIVPITRPAMSSLEIVRKGDGALVRMPDGSETVYNPKQMVDVGVGFATILSQISRERDSL